MTRKKALWVISFSLAFYGIYYGLSRQQISPTFNSAAVVWSRPVRSEADSIRFSPDNKYLLIAGGIGDGKLELGSIGDYSLSFKVRDTRLQLWDVAQQSEVERLKAQPVYGGMGPSPKLLMPDFKTLITSGGARYIKAIDIRKRRPDKTIEVNNGYISSIELSPDGKTLVLGMTREVQFLDAHTFKLLRTYEHGGQATLVSFGLSSRIVRCSWGSSSKPHFVDVKTGKQVPTPKSTREFDVFHSPDGKYFANVVKRNSIELWKREAGKSRKLKTWQTNLVQIETLQFSPDGKILAAGGLSSTETPVEFFEIASAEARPAA